MEEVIRSLTVAQMMALMRPRILTTMVFLIVMMTSQITLSIPATLMVIESRIKKMIIPTILNIRYLKKTGLTNLCKFGKTSIEPGHSILIVRHASTMISL